MIDETPNLYESIKRSPPLNPLLPGAQHQTGKCYYSRISAKEVGADLVRD
jgi:hypothetical protein